MTGNIQKLPVLVTGATGYVGGRLVPRLLEAGYRVRALARSHDKLASRAWANHPHVELVVADLLDPAEMDRAVQGCGSAYYLVHSMNPESGDFEMCDHVAARNMVIAADRAGLSRIIYLGGMGDERTALSRHLRSRAEVADILISGNTPVTYFRAAMILGSGSASFETLRYLVERLPVMVTSTRVRTPSQPIAIRNALVYLVRCLDVAETADKTFDIGGPEILTYEDMIRIYAEVAGLRKRIVLPSRLMTPRMASLMIHFVTPIPSSLGKPLSESLGAKMVVRDSGEIQKLIPQTLLTCRQAIEMALERVAQKNIRSSWMDAGAYRPPEWGRYHDAPYGGGDIRESWYRVTMRGTPEQIWPTVSAIGGERGWYFANGLWEFRGFLDRLCGGPGTRRGRRHPTDLRTGDALDWWRVIDADAPHRLFLLAEMKLPGEATLEFRLKEREPGVTELIQIASFLPRGVAGLLYWLAVLPFHDYVFRGMLTEMARAADMDILSGPDEIEPPPHRKG